MFLFLLLTVSYETQKGDLSKQRKVRKFKYAVVSVKVKALPLSKSSKEGRQLSLSESDTELCRKIQTYILIWKKQGKKLKVKTYSSFSKSIRGDCGGDRILDLSSCGVDGEP